MTNLRLLRTLRTLRTLKRALPSQSAALQIPLHLRQFHSTPLARRDLGARFRFLPPSVIKALPTPPTPAELPAPTPSGPRERFAEVEGVRIPPKPIAPGDEDCCMSGCVHCVLQIYVDDMEEYNDAFDAARAALEHKNIPRGRWPKVMDEVDDAVEAPKMDPTMSAFAALEAKLAGKAAPPPKPRSKPAIDPGVAAFMALEAKIKNKHKSEA